MADRVVHHIISACDIEVSKSGENVRIRFREKDPDLIVPTDFELEGDAKAIYGLFKEAIEILQHINSLEDGGSRAN